MNIMVCVHNISNSNHSEVVLRSLCSELHFSFMVEKTKPFGLWNPASGCGQKAIGWHCTVQSQYLHSINTSWVWATFIGLRPSMRATTALILSRRILLFSMCPLSNVGSAYCLRLTSVIMGTMPKALYNILLLCLGLNASNDWLLRTQKATIRSFLEKQ